MAARRRDCQAAQHIQVLFAIQGKRSGLDCLWRLQVVGEINRLFNFIEHSY